LSAIDTAEQGPANVNKIQNYRIGIDLGGTKIEIALIATNLPSEEANATNPIVWRHRMPTPQGDYRATLGAIKTLCSTLQAHYPASQNLAIGMGTPGCSGQPFLASKLEAFQ